MPRVNLTDVTIRNLPPSEKYVTYWDNVLPSFGIRVGRKSKTFVCVRGKTRQRISLGRYPETSVKAARQAALAYIDGSKRFPAVKASLTASQVVREYVTVLQASARWKREQERLLTKHLLPHVTTIEAVTKADILAICDRLRPVPSEQVHAFRAIRAFFNWCLARDLLEKSPAQGLPLPNTPRSRSRVLTDEEIRRIWYATPDNAYGYIVRLLILTGQRRGQIVAIRNAKLARATITWSAEHMKTRTDHTIPLTHDARLYVEALSPLLIGKTYNSWGKPKVALDKASGVTDWTLHDIRRYFSTKCAELEIEPHITERLLAHSTGSMNAVARIYNRYRYLPQMQKALLKYQDHVAGVLSSPAPAEPGNML